MTLLAGLLERAGLLELDGRGGRGRGRIRGRAASRHRARSVPTADNEAKQLAWASWTACPSSRQSGFLGAVARRWKTQLNENGKTTAGWEELPEATHNAVVGYPQPDTLKDHLLVVFLESDADHERNRLRARLSRELLEASGICHEVVTRRRGGPLRPGARRHRPG